MHIKCKYNILFSFSKMLHKELMSKQHEHELTVSYRIFPKRAQENYSTKEHESIFPQRARETVDRDFFLQVAITQ